MLVICNNHTRGVHISTVLLILKYVGVYRELTGWIPHLGWSLRGEKIIKDYFPALNEFADGECHGKIC